MKKEKKKKGLAKPWTQKLDHEGKLKYHYYFIQHNTKGAVYDNVSYPTRSAAEAVIKFDSLKNCHVEERELSPQPELEKDADANIDDDF